MKAFKRLIHLLSPMKNTQVYVYPDRTYSLKPDTNPYISDLVEALQQNGFSVVRSKTAWLGTMDIFLYLHRLDAVLFNWVEEVASRRLGYPQVLALAVLIPILKLMGIKIVWTVHNKTSHQGRNRRIAAYFRKVLARQADTILTHSTERIPASEFRPVLHFPIPFRATLPPAKQPAQFTYDLLFWGTMLPYKGIDGFLAYVHERGLAHRLRIHVQGKCPDADYFQLLKQYETDTITLVNRFTSDEELRQLFAQSRAVGFTYRSESVLSSAALTESLAYRKTVVGPNIGNFRDCSEEGLIYAYDNFDELLQIVDELTHGQRPLIPSAAIDQYIQAYSWASFAQFLRDQITDLSDADVPQTAIQAIG
jgi:glycosyltransferase involved in cell wall biosynthesis